MANTVCILDKSFPTQKKAVEFFREMRDELCTKKLIVVSPSQQFILLQNLYIKYCTATNYPLAGEIKAFSAENVTKKVNNGSSFVTTKGFYVLFDNGEKKEFSFSQAISAIANSCK